MFAIRPWPIEPLMSVFEGAHGRNNATAATCTEANSVKALRSLPAMGQACQRRSRTEPQPKSKPPTPAQAAPELVVKQHDPKRYNNDYSRFANIEDSDEEEEPQPTGDNTAEELAPPEPPEMGKMNPTQDQRRRIKDDIMELCRKRATENMKQVPEPLVGAEPPNATACKLPPDHKQPVGTLTLEQLAKYSCSNDRMLLSCHGDIFDVSSRPDIYGYGPKSWQAGKDITWSVVTGKEQPNQCNRFYDVFKLDSDHCGRYLQMICSRLLSLQDDFGEPVGRLDQFVNERLLPAAPTNEVEVNILRQKAAENLAKRSDACSAQGS
ncbi:hypothetical protein AK812_SmicGene1330 [Symbiodinium microadriaticum]|uniref:Cytochrome b5 heme-binding domain-containing protein n=1 Tax=Symbiodinium microadriaticum TaxID=2951 RepID=A0A1Q9F4F8_SYMMI|nr:hypothetical protein AK812_SmicGene1330 [Symbiodinium microadriaticum]